MRRFINSILLLTVLLCTLANSAQNPLINDQFTADPTARIFNGKVYVFPSHDIVPPDGEGRMEWFNMADYHVFSSANLTDWQDQGAIVSQDEVDWVNPDSYSMWAPDCVFENGKYYFYFPSRSKDTVNIKGFTIGVAVADKPEGPFVVEDKPIEGVIGIDPNVFIDKDGKAYLYWSSQKFYVARLKGNMKELATEPVEISNLPQEGLKEGPFIFERNGTYYLTYPHVANKTERLEYATSQNPMGPFEVKGVIMDESPTGCWTNHQSIVNFEGQWYLFYHHNDYSPDFDKLRSIRADSLFFNKDGSIQKVEPTLRGVGVVNATDKIQLDRYSDKSDEVAIEFNDSENTFEGWHAIFPEKGKWIRFNEVNFSKGLKTIKVKAISENNGILEVRSEGKNGKLVAEINIPKNSKWKIFSTDISNYISGNRDLYITSKQGAMKIDWIQFYK
jgi:hypothetical protein